MLRNKHKAHNCSHVLAESSRIHENLKYLKFGEKKQGKLDLNSVILMDLKFLKHVSNSLRADTYHNFSCKTLRNTYLNRNSAWTLPYASFWSNQCSEDPFSQYRSVELVYIYPTKPPQILLVNSNTYKFPPTKSGPFTNLGLHLHAIPGANHISIKYLLTFPSTITHPQFTSKNTHSTIPNTELAHQGWNIHFKHTCSFIWVHFWSSISRDCTCINTQQ